jgi:hypothetical protein
MPLTEQKINKLLQKVWNEGHSTKLYPSGFYLPMFKRSSVVIIGRGIMGSKGIPYKVYRGKFQRVYKKYGWRPKP